jgi:CDP-glucose 4,6-dehydratase
MKLDRDFWRGRRVLLTGHTGFKGSWAVMLLQRLGAEVVGVALPPVTTPSLFDLLRPWTGLDSHCLDIREPAPLASVVAACRPDIVIHMAAQSLTRRSYREPVATMITNVAGTVNLLEALRGVVGLDCVLVVTSDKVYRNDDGGEAFAESAPLGGDDPYAASKAAMEMVASAWSRSFFEGAGVPVATARAGNVLGGGDFSVDRLVPDIWRAVDEGSDLVLRYVDATRPWQHVLDLVTGYLVYVQALAGPDGKTVPSSLNFGPASGEEMTVRTVAETMLLALGGDTSIAVDESSLAEKTVLTIDAGKARRTIQWAPRLDMKTTLEWTADWYRNFRAGAEPRKLMSDQMDRYLELGHDG